MAIFTTPRLGIVTPSPDPSGHHAVLPARDRPTVVATISTAASDEPSVGLIPKRGVAGAALAIFLGALVIAAVLLLGPGPTFTPTAGLGVFALFYVVAQAAERGVELVLPLLPDQGGALNKKEAARKRDRAVAIANMIAVDHSSPDGEALSSAKAAADGQAALAQVVVNRRALAFALTSALGMLLCGYLHADFLTTVGVDFGDRSIPVAVLQLAVTGLIVGGGSNALHVLVGNITKATDKRDDPEETGGGS